METFNIRELQNLHYYFFKRGVIAYAAAYTNMNKKYDNFVTVLVQRYGDN